MDRDGPAYRPSALSIHAGAHIQSELWGGDEAGDRTDTSGSDRQPGNVAKV